MAELRRKSDKFIYFNPTILTIILFVCGILHSDMVKLVNTINTDGNRITAVETKIALCCKSQ